MISDSQIIVLKPSSTGKEWEEKPLISPESVRLSFTESIALISQKSQISSTPENCYFFLPNGEAFKKDEGLRERLLNRFNVPDFVASRACTEMNGYFGCKATYDDEDKVYSCSTWFRFILKMVRKEEKNEDQTENGPEYVENMVKGYKWFEMGMYSHWNYPDKCQILCVDTPDDLPSKLKEAFKSGPSSIDFRDPFALHRDLIDQIILYYDISVWRVRDPVRLLEKTRPSVSHVFEEMHDISRHTIHTSEKLSVALETIKELQRCQAEIHQNLPVGLSKTYREQAKEKMCFQAQLVRNLRHRSESNQKRLENEVNLAFNKIVHQDNTIMKSIAVLTMVFLPATFYSALFSTTFFNNSDNGWEVSSQFWIYWATSIPTTITVIIIWYVWASKPIRKLLVTLSWNKVMPRREKLREPTTKSDSAPKTGSVVSVSEVGVVGGLELLEV